MKIIIFGVGNYYQKRKKELATFKQMEVIAFSDNNETLWGKEVDGFQVISPDQIKNFSYDMILIMSTYRDEIFSQLILLGIERLKISFWELFRSEYLQGKREVFIGRDTKKTSDNKVLIISNYLDYHGGAMVSVYAAIVMQDRGYNVVLSASMGNKEFIEETVNKGITVVICPSLPYIYEKEKELINQFDLIIVNTLPMLQSAYVCGELKPTIWWIHESKDIYGAVLSKPWNCVEESKLDNLNIYAVSNLAKNNFNKLFNNRINKTLCYGIPDVTLDESLTKRKQDKVIFAIIGNICENKAHDIFVEAASSLKYKESAEFWIIGNCPDNAFGKEIYAKVHNIDSMKLLGVLTRKEMQNTLRQIDVVVCASREETMSIVVNEGMMMGKICITTENTGVADYIQDGKNGFVVPPGNAPALRNRMEWIIIHKDDITKIGKEARKTYEQYFTMEAFGKNLEKVLTETEIQWKDRHLLCSS